MVVEEVARDGFFEVLWEIAEGVIVSLLQERSAKLWGAVMRRMGTVSRRMGEPDLEAVDKAQQQDALRHDGMFSGDGKARCDGRSKGPC